MKHGDFLIRATVRDHAFRILLGDFTSLCNTCIRPHRAADAGAGLFADAICGAALLADTRMDPREKISIRCDCHGPAGGFLLDSGETGTLRGIPKNADAGRGLAWDRAVLETLCGTQGSEVEITRSLNGRIVRTGRVSCSFLLPSMALGYFLCVSDGMETEIRTRIALRANPEAPAASAEGILLQAMPDCDLVQFETIRERIHSEETGRILGKSALTPEEKLAAVLQQILSPDHPLREAPETEMLPPVRVSCSCSRERMLAMAARILKPEGLRELLREKPVTVMRCHFCNTEYRFTEKDLGDGEISGQSASQDS